MARVLLDESIPRQLREHLPGHHVETVSFRGWAGATNGDLLKRASAAFDVFVTGDQNLEYQQNLRGSPLAIVVVLAVNNRVETMVALAPKILEAIGRTGAGEVVRVAG